MSLFKRKNSPFWWIKITHNGRPVQESTKTTDKAKAQEYHDKLKASLWDQERLGFKPRYSWKEAVVRYLAETKEKTTQVTDLSHLRWVDSILSDLMLDEINRDLLDKIMVKRLAGKVANSTVNHTMEVVRAVLRKAAFDWEWI